MLVRSDRRGAGNASNDDVSTDGLSTEGDHDWVRRESNACRYDAGIVAYFAENTSFSHSPSSKLQGSPEGFDLSQFFDGGTVPGGQLQKTHPTQLKVTTRDRFCPGGTEVRVRFGKSVHFGFDISRRTQ